MGLLPAGKLGTDQLIGTVGLETGRGKRQDFRFLPWEEANTDIQETQHRQAMVSKEWKAKLDVFECCAMLETQSFSNGLPSRTAISAAHTRMSLHEMYRGFSCPLSINLAEATQKRAWTKGLLSRTVLKDK